MQARLLVNDVEADPPFADVLHEVLPDEAAHLAYLNHLLWEARSLTPSRHIRRSLRLSTMSKIKLIAAFITDFHETYSRHY